MIVCFENTLLTVILESKKGNRIELSGWPVSNLVVQRQGDSVTPTSDEVVVRWEMGGGVKARNLHFLGQICASGQKVGLVDGEHDQWVNFDHHLRKIVDRALLAGIVTVVSHGMTSPALGREAWKYIQVWPLTHFFRLVFILGRKGKKVLVKKHNRFS